MNAAVTTVMTRQSYVIACRGAMGKSTPILFLAAVMFSVGCDQAPQQRLGRSAWMSQQANQPAVTGINPLALMGSSSPGFSSENPSDTGVGLSLGKGLDSEKLKNGAMVAAGVAAAVVGGALIVKWVKDAQERHAFNQRFAGHTVMNYDDAHPPVAHGEHGDGSDSGGGLSGIGGKFMTGHSDHGAVTHVAASGGPQHGGVDTTPTGTHRAGQGESGNSQFEDKNNNGIPDNEENLPSTTANGSRTGNSTLHVSQGVVSTSTQGISSNTSEGNVDGTSSPSGTQGTPKVEPAPIYAIHVPANVKVTCPTCEQHGLALVQAQ